jgi:hypothetical protein
MDHSLKDQPVGGAGQGGEGGLRLKDGGRRT